MKTIKRNALNRGTAVYLGENRVRFVWPCGCTRVECLKTLSPAMTERLVLNWRHNGVVLEQCKGHPDHYERLSPLGRLNKDYPEER